MNIRQLKELARKGILNRAQFNLDRAQECISRRDTLGARASNETAEEMISYVDQIDEMNEDELKDWADWA